ncbi:MAG: DUF5615 family PIN-like protein [Armatimonadetes bacterium]|nr:DUF5615 family PIN-like protein [Armatimonadota bacterium]
MALRLLLDENISPVVAEQVALKRPDIDVIGIHCWRDGAFLGAPDEAVLEAANAEGRTLVTYDTQILSELRFHFDQGIPFAGLVFIDGASIPSNDFGALVRALIGLWDREKEATWANRLLFLSLPAST